MQINRTKLLKYLAMLIRGLMGPLLVALLVFFVAEPRKVLDQLTMANGRWLAAGVMLGILSEWATSIKWSILFKQVGAHLPIWPAFRISLIGMYYNNFLPSSVGGDIVRSILAGRYVGGVPRAAAGAFMQRNTGFMGLLLVVIPSLFFLPIEIRKALWSIGIPFILGVVALGFIAANIILMSERCYRLAWGFLHRMDLHSEGGWAKRLFGKCTALLQKFHGEVQGFRLLALAPMALSVATQLTDCVLVWALAQATGLDLPWQVFLFLAPLGTLGALVPVSINGLGIREVVYTIVLTQFAASKDGAVAVALLHTAIVLGLSVVGALLQGKWRTVT